MKAKMTLFSSAKQGFAVCDVEYTRKGDFYELHDIVNRANGQKLDASSVLHWHSEGNIREQIDGIPEFGPKVQVDSEPEAGYTSSVIPEDCPKKLRRFYTDDTTPSFPDLPW